MAVPPRDDASERRSAPPELGGHPAVDRARAAQHLVRTMGYQPERFARMRDQAVHVALTDGVAVDRLAEALDVRPEQVRQMAREHVLRTDAVPSEPAR